MARSKPLVELNSAQEVDAQRIYERLREVFDEELRSMARFMASKPNGQLFGQTEFDLRDRVHELGAGCWKRPSMSGKKRAVTKELAWSVRNVRRCPVRRAARQVVREFVRPCG